MWALLYVFYTFADFSVREVAKQVIAHLQYLLQSHLQAKQSNRMIYIKPLIHVGMATCSIDLGDPF